MRTTENMYRIANPIMLEKRHCKCRLTGINLKRKKYIFYIMIAILWLSFNAASCSMEPKEYRITVKNNSNHNIGVCFPYGRVTYPDTTLPENIYAELEIRGSIKSGLYAIYSNPHTYRKFYQFYGGDTLSIFILHTDTILNNTWEDIRNGDKILKRYDISYQEMEALDGDLCYPPSEKMKDIKMYPPYQ